MAARLAKVHGIGRTAEVLSLDYDRLKTRAEAVVVQPQSSPQPSVICSAIRSKSGKKLESPRCLWNN
jgi:hypothetical protein